LRLHFLYYNYPDMLTIDPKTTSTGDFHQFLLGAVAPRPIAFASTIDKDGNANLAPYSFFNAFSSNPPTLVFSSNRRVSDNTTKDTLHNIEENMEVVINVVNHNIVRQMAIASISYPSEVNEFEKAGLTPISSDLIAPFRVRAGHLIIAEVLRMHVDEKVVDENNRIDPHKIDLMGRMGRAYYVRASGAAIQTIIQPVTSIGIGFDQLPKSALDSHILSANNLAQMAGLTTLPNEIDILKLKSDSAIQLLLQQDTVKDNLHRHAIELIENNEVEKALAVISLVDHL